MTETVGYYCPECGKKYVRHKCKDSLPCGHGKENAIYVYHKWCAKRDNKIVMRRGNIIYEDKIDDDFRFPRDMLDVKYQHGFRPDMNEEDLKDFQDAFEKKDMSLKRPPKEVRR